MKVMKTKTWILIIAAFTLAAVAASAWILLSRKGAGVVEIVQDGKVLQEIDLKAVTEPYTFEVASEQGTNVIEVEPGRIRIKEADCRDRFCVNQGWLSDGVVPIVCLPHRLVIRVKDAGSADAVAL